MNCVSVNVEQMKAQTIESKNGPMMYFAMSVKN